MNQWVKFWHLFPDLEYHDHVTSIFSFPPVWPRVHLWFLIFNTQNTSLLIAYQSKKLKRVRFPPNFCIWRRLMGVSCIYPQEGGKTDKYLGFPLMPECIFRTWTLTRPGMYGVWPMRRIPRNLQVRKWRHTFLLYDAIGTPKVDKINLFEICHVYSPHVVQRFFEISQYYLFYCRFSKKIVPFNFKYQNQKLLNTK